MVMTYIVRESCLWYTEKNHIREFYGNLSKRVNFIPGTAFYMDKARF